MILQTSTCIRIEEKENTKEEKRNEKGRESNSIDKKTRTTPADRAIGNESRDWTGKRRGLNVERMDSTELRKERRRSRRDVRTDRDGPLEVDGETRVTCSPTLHGDDGL